MRDLNTLLVGASAEELRSVLPALAATQAHATARLLEETALLNGQRREGLYLTAAQVAKLTGYSRSFLYAHGEQLGIAIRPVGAPMRFPEARVREWMERRRA